MKWLQSIFGGDKPGGANQPALLPEGMCVYAVGDIHGRADLLEKLLDIVALDVLGGECPTVKVIFLGDYIDRGFQSKAVIDILLDRDWGAIEPLFLKGNHEQTLLDFLDAPNIGPQWIEYGGRETLNAYGVKAPDQKSDMIGWEKASKELEANLPHEHLNFLKGLKSWFELGNCYFVHAGVDPNKRLAEQTDEDRLWIRERFLMSSKKHEKLIIHGHTPEDRPYSDKRRVGVDTGAYITNRLTSARIQGNSISFLTT